MFAYQVETVSMSQSAVPPIDRFMRWMERRRDAATVREMQDAEQPNWARCAECKSEIAPGQHYGWRRNAKYLYYTCSKDCSDDLNAFLL